MKNPLNRFFRITVPALVITLGFINCSLGQLPEDEKPDPSKFLGTWVTQEKDGIVKEVEILDNYNYNYIERTYVNGVQINQRKRTYNYVKGWYYVGTAGKSAEFFDFDDSDDITFSIQNNELTLGGGDIKYKGNNDYLEGKWSCEFEKYRVDITFVPNNNKSEGKVEWKLTYSGVYSAGGYPAGAYSAGYFNYEIKNEKTLIFTDYKYYDGHDEYIKEYFSKIVEIIDGKLHIKNLFVQNEQIKKYNEAHSIEQLQYEIFLSFCHEMFADLFVWVDVDHPYSFFDEEYHKK